MKKVFAFIAAIFVLWLLFFRSTAVQLGPGIQAPEPPVQQNLNSADSFLFGEYFITPLADFQITAKILSKENYSWDRESDLSGSLVRAKSSDGWRWVSSMSRSDRGNGSCELIYVEQAKVVKTEK